MSLAPFGNYLRCTCFCPGLSHDLRLQDSIWSDCEQFSWGRTTALQIDMLFEIFSQGAEALCSCILLPQQRDSPAEEAKGYVAERPQGASAVFLRGGFGAGQLQIFMLWFLSFDRFGIGSPSRMHQDGLFNQALKSGAARYLSTISHH